LPHILRLLARRSAPKRGWASFSLRLGGFGFRGRGPRSLPCEPFCLQTLTVVREGLLRDLVLSHCLLGIDLAKCLTRIALGFGGRLWWSALVVEARPAALSFLRLQPDLDCLSRQPFCSKAFVVCMEFWLGLAVRYRLPRRKRVESPSLELVRNLLLGTPLRLGHLLFPFNPSSTRPRMLSNSGPAKTPISGTPWQ